MMPQPASGDSSNPDTAMRNVANPSIVSLPAPAPYRRWRWILLGVGAVAVAVAVLVWDGMRSADPAVKPPVDPPMPAEIQDAEVRDAVRRARQSVIDQPDSAEAWGHLGMVLLANLFDQEATRCFTEAERLSPDSPAWPYARGIIALKRDPANALDHLRRAVAVTIARDPYDVPARLLLAEALFERQNIDEAEQLFRGAWHDEPGDPRAAMGLAMIALGRGKDKEAEEFLSAARRSPYANKMATAQLAILARRRGDKTASDLDRELAALPDDQAWPDPLLDPIIRMRVGRRGRERAIAQLERQGRYLDAAEIYLEQIELAPTAQAYVGAGINLARLEDYRRALPLLHEALRLDPNDAQANFTLAITLFRRAEKAWHTDSDRADARNWFKESIPYARRATELKPNNARAYLHWGLALKYLGEPAAALAPLRQGIVCLPGDFDLQLGLGEALLETGAYDDAKKHLENARQLDEKDQRVIQALERVRNKK